MLELYEFLLLNQDEKANFLWTNGVFVFNLKERAFSYNLYSLNGYYVEVTLSNAQSKIIEIKPFRKGLNLDKFLDMIKID